MLGFIDAQSLNGVSVGMFLPLQRMVLWAEGNPELPEDQRPATERDGIKI